MDVMGPTVTVVIAVRAASQVSTTTGRVPSERASRITRILIGDVEVAGRPLHKGI